MIGKGEEPNYMKRHTYQTKRFHLLIHLNYYQVSTYIVKIQNLK